MGPHTGVTHRRDPYVWKWSMITKHHSLFFRLICGLESFGSNHVYDVPARCRR